MQGNIIFPRPFSDIPVTQVLELHFVAGGLELGLLDSTSISRIVTQSWSCHFGWLLLMSLPEPSTLTVIANTLGLVDHRPLYPCAIWAQKAL